MANVARTDESVVLFLSNDEADALTMVLAHVNTLSDFDTYSVFDALTDDIGLEDIGELLHRRSSVKVSVTEPGDDGATVFEPNATILFTQV